MYESEVRAFVTLHGTGGVEGGRGGGGGRCLAVVQVFNQSFDSVSLFHWIPYIRACCKNHVAIKSACSIFFLNNPPALGHDTIHTIIKTSALVAATDAKSVE